MTSTYKITYFDQGRFQGYLITCRKISMDHYVNAWAPKEAYTTIVEEYPFGSIIPCDAVDGCPRGACHICRRNYYDESRYKAWRASRGDNCEYNACNWYNPNFKHDCKGFIESLEKQGLKDVFSMKCQKCNDFLIDWNEDCHYIAIYAAKQTCRNCMYPASK